MFWIKYETTAKLREVAVEALLPNDGINGERFQLTKRFNVIYFPQTSIGLKINCYT